MSVTYTRSHDRHIYPRLNLNKNPGVHRTHPLRHCSRQVKNSETQLEYRKLHCHHHHPTGNPGIHCVHTRYYCHHPNRPTRSTGVNHTNPSTTVNSVIVVRTRIRGSITCIYGHHHPHRPERNIGTYYVHP